MDSRFGPWRRWRTLPSERKWSCGHESQRRIRGEVALGGNRTVWRAANRFLLNEDPRRCVVERIFPVREKNGGGTFIDWMWNRFSLGEMEREARQVDDTMGVQDV